MKLFLEAIAVFSIKRFLEQPYAGAIMIYLDYSYMESVLCFAQGRHQSMKSALLLGKGTALKLCKEGPFIFLRPQIFHAMFASNPIFPHD